MSTDDHISELIGLIYEAAVEPNGWLEVLRRIADLVRADSGLLGVGSYRRPSDGMAIPLTLNVDPEQQQRWVESYLDQDVWWRAFSERFEDGVLTGAQCVEPHLLHTTELYNEVLVHAGIEDGLFGGIARSPGSDAIAAFYRARHRERFGAREVDLLSTLLPHLRRAVRINDRFGLLESESAAARIVGGLVPIGIVYLDGHGHVLGVNSHAERLLDQEDRLLIRQRRLRTSSQSDDAALDAAIAMAQEPGAVPTGQLLPLTRSRPGSRIVMYVAPVPRMIERSRLSGHRGASVVVLITSTEALASWPTPVAARALGLTPAEAELALALARGEDLQAHATSRGLSRETARWRMKQILHKTSSKRQSDVVRLVLTTLGRLVATEDARSAPSRVATKPAVVDPTSRRRA